MMNFKKGSIIYRIKTLYEPTTKDEIGNNEIAFVLNDTNLQSYSIFTVCGKQLYRNSSAIDWKQLI
jgi:hypothetical protein